MTEMEQRRLSVERLKPLWWWLSDSDWRRRYRQDRHRIGAYRLAQRRAVRQLLAVSGTTVLAGPFKGMSFSTARVDPHCAQILLGTYERELHPAIEEICRRPYSLIVNIGADKGYYVCGLKLRMRGVRVVAFESGSAKHEAIRTLLRDNDVPGGVTIEGLCDCASLERHLADERRPFVVCDVDGAEVELLDPASVPALRRTDILVETHDGLRDGITALLTRRFDATHHVEVITESVRTIEDAPKGTALSGQDLVEAMDEFRGFPQSWLSMTVRSPQE